MGVCFVEEVPRLSRVICVCENKFVMIQFFRESFIPSCRWKLPVKLMRPILKKCFNVWLAVAFVAQVLALPIRGFAQSSESLSIKKEETSQKSGSVYYTTNKKSDIVVKTNIWGAVQYPGVHYIPLGTRFLEAISIAGGPVDRADTKSILLSSKDLNEVSGSRVHTISLEQALAKEEFNRVLKPDDIIIVKEDRTTERVQFYLGIGTFVLSVVALGLLIDDRNKR